MKGVRGERRGQGALRPAVYDPFVPRVLVLAPRSPHTEKWLTWIDALPGWKREMLTYGQQLPSVADGGRMTAAINLARGVRRLRAAGPCDLVHAHWLAGPGWIGSLAGRRPLAISVWGSDILLHADRSRLGARLTRLATTRADAVIYDAEVLAEALIGKGFPPERLHRIVLGPNSRDFQAVAAGDIARSLGVPHGMKLVLSPRGTSPVYDPETAVAAFAAARVSDAVLLVRLGNDDRDSVDLDELARRHGVADRVFSYRSVAAHRLPSLYASADVVLSVPRSDGTSVTVLEALFCERPVIATDLPANREWLPDEFLAPVGNAEALGIRVRRALVDPAWTEPLVRRASLNARTNADEATQIGATRELYERLTSSRPADP
jgi:L-malate glycosyltransferase